MYREALLDIQRYKIGPREHPLTLGFMGRKVGKDFGDTTLETWKRFIPAGGYEIKGNPPDIIIAGRVKYLTGGLDRTETISKFSSAEYARAFIDQAEETTEDDIRLLRAATHQRLIINKKQIQGKILWTANPAQCWLKGQFIDNPPDNRRFIQALPGDNPWLGEKYVQTLRETFEHRPELLEAYLYGSWDALEGANQIIKAEWVRLAAQRTIYFAETVQLLTCDTARFGDDETVIYLLDNTEINKEATVILPQTTTTQISNQLAALSLKYNNCPIVVESTGADLGAGVIDELAALKRTAIIYNPQGRSNEPERFYNIRAEAWSNAAQMFVKNEIQLQNADTTLVNQLCSPTYKFRKGRTLIESKDDIKKRLGRSPDRADAYIMGLWALDKVGYSPQQEIPIGFGDQTDMAESYNIPSVL